jgi:hypothetical protein
MSFKSPIKDPNNFVSAATLKEIIPKEKRIKSFLLFSGEIEFPLFSAGYNIQMNTNKFVTYEFWHCAREDSYNVAEQAASVHSRTHPQSIYHYQDTWPQYKDPYLRSALFYLLNRYSPTGTISYGDVNRNNFSSLSLENLRRFSEHSDNLSLGYYREEDFMDGFDKIDKEDLILLPIGKYSYGLLGRESIEGHETYHVNHKKLKEKLIDLGNDFVLIYKNHPRLMHQFGDFNMTFVNKYGQVTKKPELSEEVIISNLGI